uniref:Ubiquitin-like protease family profile domain-containing protein n=1 Tax=Chenopodium quinoa TaxID=63459 RepID=A0A803N9J7_CHEQI
MGFGALLELDMKNIPRQFCYWLMARVREDATMVFGEGEILPMGPKQVRCVLGISMGSKPVPMDIGEDEDKIMLQPVSLLTENDEEEFMVAFMIVLLGKLLCTTTNSSNSASSLIPCVTVASHASEYDWCTFTIDWLCDTARRFQSKFMRDGYRSGCGGSLLFVMIFYLDHLHRKPVKWGVFPRVTVWNFAEIRAALVEDKVTGDEYGKLLAYDIAYGEEHPLVTRDVDFLSRDGSLLTNSEQMNALLSKQLTPKLETLVENVIVKTFSCYVSKMTSMCMGHNLGDFGRNMTIGSIGEKDNGGGEDRKASANSLARDNPTGVVGKLDGFIEKRLVGFVKAWKDLKNENAPGPSVIECDGIDATQRDCYRVVSPRARVGDQYVRMASVLYTKTWSAQHCMKRIMLDPSYAHFVMLGKDEYKSLGKKYCKRVLSHPVFVPVLLPEKNAEHWFCLALELKSHRIWMIDSMYEDPFSRHEAIVEMLLNALEELLHTSNPLWIVGTLENWVRSVYPVRQSDTCSCGPLMLATVKHCAQSFEAELHLDTIGKVRKDLFLEDVNSDFNQIRGNLENILPKESRGHRRAGSQSTS